MFFMSVGLCYDNGFQMYFFISARVKLVELGSMVITYSVAEAELHKVKDLDGMGTLRVWKFRTMERVHAEASQPFGRIPFNNRCAFRLSSDILWFCVFLTTTLHPASEQDVEFIWHSYVLRGKYSYL